MYHFVGSRVVERKRVSRSWKSCHNLVVFELFSEDIFFARCLYNTKEMLVQV